MPEQKVVERRLQTQHKLNLMERYWAAWLAILARSHGSFCKSHLWLIDALAGSGLHESESDPDGVTSGTPLLAVHAARIAQRAHRGLTVHVRAIEIDRGLASQLDSLASIYRGTPPDRVDVVVYPEDFRRRVQPILDEIHADDHPDSRGAGHGPHLHRSLWLFDPFGVDPIEHGAIDSLGVGSEVIVNLDLMAIIRHAGKALGGDRRFVDLLDRVYGGDTWRRAADARPQELHRAYADEYALSFARSYRLREAYPLRATGSQDRFVVHLTNAETAKSTFIEDYDRAMRIGTAAGGSAMSGPQRATAAEQLQERHRGETLTIQEMRRRGSPFGLGQLRTICATGEQRGLGRWDPATATMRWFLERGVDPDAMTLEL